MIRSFLRRWLGVGPNTPELNRTEGEAAGALSRRVTELEESLEYLWLAHKKLRGRVTGGLRAAEVDAAAEAESLPNPPRGNALALELLARRRAHAVPR